MLFNIHLPRRTAVARAVQASAVLLAAAWLAGCAQTGAPGAKADAASGTKASAASAAAQSRAESGVDGMPTEQNTTPFFTLSSATGIDESVKVPYYTYRAKASFTYDQQGRLTRVDKNEPLDEGFMPLDAPETADLACKPWGAGYNQRVGWHPSTGVFVAGGAPTAIRGKQPIALAPLDQRDQQGLLFSALRVNGVQALWAPCVGEKPATGYQANRYLGAGDRIALRAEDGTRVQLALPSVQTPYVMLVPSDVQEKGFGVVPMRLAIVAVDMARRHVSLQWEATTPQLERTAMVYMFTPTAAEVRGAKPPYRDAYRQADAHLAACAAPTSPIEPCAWPKAFTPYMDPDKPQAAPRARAARRR